MSSISLINLPADCLNIAFDFMDNKTFNNVTILNKAFNYQTSLLMKCRTAIELLKNEEIHLISRKLIRSIAHLDPNSKQVYLQAIITYACIKSCVWSKEWIWKEFERNCPLLNENRVINYLKEEVSKDHRYYDEEGCTLLISTIKNYGQINGKEVTLFSKTLLELGANPNTPYNYSALFTCISKPKHLSLLLSHGADVNAEDGHGNTFLHKICEIGFINNESHGNCFKLFLKYRPSPSIINRDQRTPRRIAEVLSNRQYPTLLSNKLDVFFFDQYTLNYYGFIYHNISESARLPKVINRIVFLYLLTKEDFKEMKSAKTSIIDTMESEDPTEMNTYIREFLERAK